MSSSIGNEWPAPLQRLLDGRALEMGIGETIILLTSDEAGWSSVALLSVGEVVAPSARTVRLALWPGTTTTANLTRSGRGVLAFFGAGYAYFVRFEAQRLDDLPAGGMNHAFFDGTIADVRHDAVTYAQMTSGLQFELPERDKVLDRWRATVEAMLAAGGETSTAS